MLSCNGQGLLCLLTILELLFEPTLVSDCPRSPSGKSHCSGSDQSSAALNRDRNKKNSNRPRTTYMSSVTASTSSHFVRNGPELPSSTLLLPTALLSGNCTTLSFRLICSTSSLPFTTYLTDQILANVTIVLESTSSRFVIQIFWNADSYSWFSGMPGSAEAL